MTNCIFCKIAKGEIPSSKVYEDKDIIAFLDIAPANKGHCLVVPKEHYETLTDIPAELLKKLTIVVQKAAKALSLALGTDGYNMFMNNGRAAGQLVPHAHFHIVPRFATDGIRFEWPHKKYDDKEMQAYQEKIKKFL